MIFCETSIRVSLYYFLPKQEFRTLLFGLYDLRLEFMEKLGEIVGNSKEFFKKQYDCLFTRATRQVILAVNFLRQLSYKGLITTAGLGEPELVGTLIGLLWKANRQYIIGQLIPSVSEVVHSEF